MTQKAFLQFLKDSGIENFIDMLETGFYFNVSIKMQVSHVVNDRFTKMYHNFEFQESIARMIDDCN